MVSSLMFVLPRPPQAMNAMFNLSFRFRPRSSAGAPVSTPAAATAPPTNSRRVIRRWRVLFVAFFMTLLLAARVAAGMHRSAYHPCVYFRLDAPDGHDGQVVSWRGAATKLCEVAQAGVDEPFRR